MHFGFNSQTSFPSILIWISSSSSFLGFWILISLSIFLCNGCGDRDPGVGTQFLLLHLPLLLLSLFHYPSSLLRKHLWKVQFILRSWVAFSAFSEAFLARLFSCFRSVFSHRLLFSIIGLDWILTIDLLFYGFLYNFLPIVAIFTVEYDLGLVISVLLLALLQLL